jgi:hypothetical protein
MIGAAIRPKPRMVAFLANIFMGVFGSVSRRGYREGARGRGQGLDRLSWLAGWRVEHREAGRLAAAANFTRRRDRESYSLDAGEWSGGARCRRNPAESVVTPWRCTEVRSASTARRVIGLASSSREGCQSNAPKRRTFWSFIVGSGRERASRGEVLSQLSAWAWAWTNHRYLSAPREIPARISAVSASLSSLA